MKSLIRAITIIIVPVLLTIGSLVPLTGQELTSERGQVSIAEKAPAMNSSDSLTQLRTLLSATTQQNGGGKVLVIPTTEIPPQDMVTLMEDMTVMYRIFDKKMTQASLIPQTPPWVALTGVHSMGNSSMEAMYVQGCGALFMINVDFPLTPPPEREEKKDDTEEATDQVWEQMKEEIFSPQQTMKRTSGHQEQQYDAQKVNNLKTTLIEALVHAANIRGLKPDESVILTVTGSGNNVSSNVDGVVAISGTNQVVVHYKDKNVTKILTSPSLNDLEISSPTVMVIRVKKSYIDALAQNKVDKDEFEQKIQLISYPSLGQNISSRPFPSLWPTGTTGYTLPSSTPRDVSESTGINLRRSRSR